MQPPGGFLANRTTQDANSGVEAAVQQLAAKKLAGIQFCGDSEKVLPSRHQVDLIDPVGDTDDAGFGDTDDAGFGN